MGRGLVNGNPSDTNGELRVLGDAETSVLLSGTVEAGARAGADEEVCVCARVCVDVSCRSVAGALKDGWDTTLL